VLLIPVKDQRNAKQRLAAVLSPEERFALAQAMLEDVLAAVAAVAPRPPVALVTSDASALELARGYGFGVIEDCENAGETAAIAMATRVAIERGAEWSLVVPGDAPLVTAAEIDTILNAAPGAGSVLVPDHKGRGSNAVLRRPADLFPLRFGDDSFAPHRAAAEASGRPCVVLQLPGIALDVDRPADLALLALSDSTTRSRRLVGSWRVAERIRTVTASS